METAKLYVGNLAFSTTEDELRQFFSQAGEVGDVRLITDRETGRSKGFGFVTMANEAGADKALEFNGQEVGGRKLRIDKARPSTGGGGSGGRGGRPSGGGGRGGREQRQY